MTAASTTRRNVMLSAWRRFRDAKADGKPINFSRALKSAWAGEKRMANSCDASLAKAVSRGGRVSFGSPIYSPTSRTMAGPRYSGFQDRQAGRLISTVGR